MASSTLIRCSVGVVSEETLEDSGFKVGSRGRYRIPRFGAKGAGAQPLQRAMRGGVRLHFMLSVTPLEIMVHAVAVAC